MKRFWTDVNIAPDGDAFAILLDGRPVRTPGRKPMLLPNAALAEAVAKEWRDVEEALDPRAMPLTGIANAAIDIVAEDPISFAERLATYAESDLLCYRASHPVALAERQGVLWDRHLAAVEQRYDICFHRAEGIVHVPQPAESLERVRNAFAALSPYQLAALDPIVTISGSALIGLELAENLTSADEAFEASMFDELWQEEQWGPDPEAIAARNNRRALFLAAATFLALATGC